MKKSRFAFGIVLFTLPLGACSFDAVLKPDSSKTKIYDIQIDSMKFFKDDGSAHVYYTSTEDPFAYQNIRFKRLLVNDENPISYSYNEIKHSKGYFDVKLSDLSSREYTFTWYDQDEEAYLEGSTRKVEKYNPIGPEETVVLEGIELSNKKTDYEVGDSFVKPTVTAIYSNDTTEVVTEQTEFSGYDLNQAGSYTVLARYLGKSAGYSITVSQKQVPVTLQRIEVSNQKTEYKVGDEFIKPTVTAYYSNNTNYIVTDMATFTGYNLNQTGNQTVTVTYSGAQTSYQITVKPADAIVYPDGYTKLAWQDEFNGTSVDNSKWNYDIGNGDWGWGNGESEYYRSENATVSNGQLHITARKENFGNCEYTSSRMVTRGKYSFKYGYIEAKIYLPEVNGMWPAFWMLPENNVYGGWPHSGEIDIMEARGRVANMTTSAIHFSKEGHTYRSGETYFSSGSLSTGHIYACEWTEDMIRMYVDGYNYISFDKYVWSTDGAPTSVTAPFDQNFHIILNLAIGGQFDNWNMPPSNFNSADMIVDYVRVFQK